jgi:hypothetical protein
MPSVIVGLNGAFVDSFGTPLDTWSRPLQDEPKRGNKDFAESPDFKIPR